MFCGYMGKISIVNCREVDKLYGEIFEALLLYMPDNFLAVIGGYENKAIL